MLFIKKLNINKVECFPRGKEQFYIYFVDLQKDFELYNCKGYID